MLRLLIVFVLGVLFGVVGLFAVLQIPPSQAQPVSARVPPGQKLADGIITPVPTTPNPAATYGLAAPACPTPHPITLKRLEDAPDADYVQGALYWVAEKKGVRGFPTPFFVSNLAQQQTSHYVGQYYAATLEHIYYGTLSKTPQEFYEAWVDKMARENIKSKEAADITFQDSIGAMATKWDRCSAVSQFVADPANNWIVWLVAEGSRFGNLRLWKEANFQEFWTRFRFEANQTPGLTWPAYLWKQFGPSS